MLPKIPKIESKNIDSSIGIMQFMAAIILTAIIFKFFSDIESMINNERITLIMLITFWVIINIYFVHRYIKIRNARKNQVK